MEEYIEIEEDEVWKELLFTAKPYFISNRGRLYTITKGRKQIIKPYINKGYYYVNLTVEGYFRYNISLARLMALVFFEGENSLLRIKFKDGNKLNCSLDNIEFIKSNHRRKLVRDYYYAVDVNGVTVALCESVTSVAIKLNMKRERVIMLIKKELILDNIKINIWRNNNEKRIIENN